MLTDYEEYGVVQAGRALAYFILHIDTIKTEIGEYKNGSKYCKEGFIVTGIQLEDIKSPINILTRLSDLNIDMSENFKNYMGESPINLIESYFSKISGGVKEIYKKEIINKLIQINSNKQVVVPFKPLDECRISVDKDRDRGLKILFVTWNTDKDTGEIKSNITVRVKDDNKSGNTYKIPVSEYGKEFKIATVERSLRSDKIDRDIIRFNDAGLIKPLVVNDGKIALALDCKHMYIVHDSRIVVIGNWDNRGNLIEIEAMSQIRKSRAYKYIKNNMNYIVKHRRFIAPYKLVSENIVKI